MIALDTNVLIYACARSDLGPQSQALDLIEAARALRLRRLAHLRAARR
jgi:predicted nucleic acid-binding protein